VSSDDRLQGASGEIGDRAGFRTILVMLAILALAVVVTIHTIEVSPAPVYSQRPNPSPLGYTYSLALFAFPMTALLWWASARGLLLHLRAVRLTVGLLFPLWCLLDVLLGNTFFRFPVASATLEQLRVWGYVPGVGFERSIPIEEFLFYFGGCVVLILLYIWSSEEWYSRYSMDPATFNRRARSAPPLVELEHRVLVWGAILFAAALGYKKLGPHAHHDGFPGYFLILLALVALPTAALFRQVKTFINGRAFLFTLLVVTLMSLLWEVTLALPYGWWNYREAQMIGVFVVPWSGIPIEACLLWVAAGWGEVFIYEAFKIYVHSGRTLRQVLFGAAPAVGQR
jgi:hypothetical protein